MTDLPAGSLPRGSVPGPPPVLWAPSLGVPGSAFQPPLAIWHPHWKVWVVLELGDPIGDIPPEDSVLLSPAVGAHE